MRTSEKNRFTNALTVGNCKLDMVFSDIFGKTSSAIINTILLQNEYNDEDILKNIQKFSELMVIIWYNFSASVNRYQKRGD